MAASGLKCIIVTLFTENILSLQRNYTHCGFRDCLQTYTCD